jgi:hypothetical protein
LWGVKFLIATIIALFLFGFKESRAQSVSSLDTLRVYAYINEIGDTIPMGYLPEVEVKGILTAKWAAYHREWTRLRNAVYVTYPYAIAASKIMNEVNDRLQTAKDKKERRKIIQSREKELKKEFADKLTSLSVYQGKVLMKLIYRETGNHCYSIIQEYKGGFSAGFWQTIALVFGSNLKMQYDPLKKDSDMEKIVKEVERMYGYKS